MAVPEIPEAEYAEPDISPECRLFGAVIHNAWDDAFGLTDTAIKNTDRAADPVLIRQEARRWLTSDLEPWKTARQTICDHASISEPLVRQAAKKRLALAKLDDEKREAESHAKAKAHIDRLFENLLARADGGLHPGRLDSQLRKIAEIEEETL